MMTTACGWLRLRNLIAVAFALACWVGARPAAAQSRVATTSPQATEQMAAAADAQRQAELQTEQVSESLDAVREILNIGLSNSDAGELLREARRRAPDPGVADQRVTVRERELATARLDRVRLMDARRTIDDPVEAARLSDQLNEQEAYLASLKGALAAERELAAKSRELVALLDARLLWIGSAPAIGPQWLADVVHGASWLGNPRSWLELGRTLLRRIMETPIGSALIGLLVIGLLWSRPKLRKRFPHLAESVGDYQGDSFLLTVRAVVVTLLLALPIPLALVWIGWLFAAQNIDLFAAALGEGLKATAAVWLLLDFVRQMCRKAGVADAHFQWNQEARQTLLNNLRWLIAVEVPSAMVTASCDAAGDEVNRQGLGRLAFIVGSAGLTIFMARVFRPGSGVFSGLLARDGWGWRLRKLWYWMLVLLPGALTIAAAAGYYYTATQVQSRFFASGALALAGVVLYSLLKRWLLVTRRRLAMRQARQKLVEQRARKRKEASESTAAAEDVPELEPQTVDIDAASDQTLVLLRTLVAAGVLAALWGVWKDVLPALTVLERVQLSKPTLDASGAVLVAPVTLWSLLLGLFAGVLTIIAARNLPAVLELVVLQRFPIDAGIRYAAATLTRYAVVAVGIVVASNLLGIEWSRAQWIIAALGVGLGFGLQEIVANFVSGLIILFERPIRVGDTVTVGDVTGTVSRLRIRATTIIDWNNKEVIVPNKSFITDLVVNWTLSNSVTRLIVRVGVAYGSDMAKVQEVIAAAVRSVPAVLAEPVPSVLFMGFGDSSLDLEVRACISDLSKRLSTLHELHMAINTALVNAKVEIPFPQRDLHLRSSSIGRLAAESRPAPSDA
jgi:potassium efflux system protein